MIAVAVAENTPIATDATDGQGPSTWADIHARYREIVGHIPRTATLTQLAPIANDLAALAAHILILLETHVNSLISSANELSN